MIGGCGVIFKEFSSLDIGRPIAVGSSGPYWVPGELELAALFSRSVERHQRWPSAILLICGAIPLTGRRKPVWLGFRILGGPFCL